MVRSLDLNVVDLCDDSEDEIGEMRFPSQRVLQELVLLLSSVVESYLNDHGEDISTEILSQINITEASRRAFCYLQRLSQLLM